MLLEAWILALAGSGLGTLHDQQGDDPVRLVVEGRFVQALDAARAEGDSLRRWQNEFHVLHTGGALEAAMLAGSEGARLFPEDPWLWERVVYVALTLRQPDAAREHLNGLEQALAGLTPSLREPWLSTLGNLASQVADLEAARSARARGLARAQLTVAIVLALLAMGSSLGWTREFRNKSRPAA